MFFLLVYVVMYINLCFSYISMPKWSCIILRAPNNRVIQEMLFKISLFIGRIVQNANNKDSVKVRCYCNDNIVSILVFAFFRIIRNSNNFSIILELLLAYLLTLCWFIVPDDNFPLSLSLISCALVWLNNSMHNANGWPRMTPIQFLPC